jgi:hypothetical protein
MGLIIMFLALFAVLMIIVGIALLVFYFIGFWKVFSKAGQAGWKSLIPWYNNWVLMVDICDMHIGYFITSLSIAVLTVFISMISVLLFGLEAYVANSILQIVTWILGLISYAINFAVYYNLGKKFNKGTGWVILTFFFNIITIPILGLSKKSVYTDVEVSKHSLFCAIGK